MGRREILGQLQGTEPFDLLVVGGGATGLGVAVDAASRGLRVALVEKNDFAEGTSGRSTKLVHGGVRYLELAVTRLDRTHFHLVKDALRERAVLLRLAPHLCRPLPLVTPLYAWAEIPYVYAGLKLYDLLGGAKGVGHSRLLGRSEALRRFPMLQAEGLKAGVLYYDGQFSDLRMAVALALTAQEQGAVLANHVGAVGLCKSAGRVAGARVRDSLTGDEWCVSARVVVNATGPFADTLRRLDDPATKPLLRASSGIHIVLDGRFAPPDTGLLIPKTEDGRVLFVLPWEGHALVGTTDEPAAITEHPRPREEEITYLLRHVGRYFNLQVGPADILACWSGLRPLVFDPKAADTAHLARDHFLEESRSGLFTITGGKWTTYRKMAQDVVDHTLPHCRPGFEASCRTQDLSLAGGAGFDPDGWEGLTRDHGLDSVAARHLNSTYGDRAPAVARLAGQGYGRFLAPGHPFLEAEVVHAVREEFAVRAIDVLARRTPLALLDRAAARAAVRRVVELMGGELGWDGKRCAAETTLVEERLDTAL